MKIARRGARYYIAYGEYLSIMQMAQKCITAERIGKSFIRGWKLDFRGTDGNAGENIVPCSDGVVPVCIWRVAMDDEVELDLRYKYPYLYTKKEFSVIKDGRIYTGFTYVMNGSFPSASLSKVMKMIMQEGYTDIDIPVAEWDSRFF